MKRSLLIFFVIISSLSVFAQIDITKTKKPLKIWIYTRENSEEKGVFAGASDSVVFIYHGSISAYTKDASPELVSISYKDIDVIKVKKSGGFAKGLLIGAGIGLLPIVF